MITARLSVLDVRLRSRAVPLPRRYPARVRPFIGTLLVALALLVAPDARAAGPYPPPSSGSGSVDPSRISRGQCAVFSGNGFSPGETIRISDDGVAIGVTTATADGRFQYRYCPSDEARLGRHVLKAEGLLSGLVVTATVVITGISQSRPQPGGQPGADGQPGLDGQPGVVTSPAAVSGPPDVRGSGPGDVPDVSGSAGEGASSLRLLPLLVGAGVVTLVGCLALLLLLLAARRRRPEEVVPA